MDKRIWLATACFLSISVLYPAHAETLQGALAKAYTNNSTLNSARAGVRVTDENVAIAKSAMRPFINGSGNLDYTSQSGSRTTSGNLGITIDQTLFDGFQTRNSVESNKSQVSAANENLRNTEQSILLQAVDAYMGVILERRIVDLEEQNLKFLNEQVRAANSRLEVGEGTRTDVAQAEAQKASALASLSLARAELARQSAVYQQVVGVKPGTLSAASTPSKLLPANLNKALAIASNGHPAILALQHLVDASAFSVKSTEGRLLPSVTGSADISRDFRDSSGSGLPGVGLSNGTSSSAGAGLNLTVPIYQGGRVAAEVRQSKESLSQARIDVDAERDTVREQLTSAWSAYQSALGNVSANREQASYTKLALNGVIEERNVGQRTTLDVLESQADVITAQINLATSQRDVVYGGYQILMAMGKLSARNLGLAVSEYKPQEHYKAVKDKWAGTRTPDGR